MNSGSNLDFYYMCESQKVMDRNRGASYIPAWVTKARLRGDHVRMHELEYWVNYTNRVSLNKKLTSDEWSQVKIFDLPKKTLKLQVEPEHLDVFLSTVKYVKPRKDPHDKYVHIIIESSSDGRLIISINWLYGRFDDSNLSENFELEREEKYDTFDYAEYKFQNKYAVKIYKCTFNEDQE